MAGDYDLSVFTEREARQRATEGLSAFLAAFSHPDLSQDFLLRAGRLTLTTLAMAIVGTALGVVGGLLLGVLASRNVVVADAWRGTRLPRRLLCGVARLSQDVLRGVPDFAWAILSIPVLGLGPMAGVAAIALSASGVLGRLYSELFDSVPPRSLEPLRGVGAGRLQTLIYGVAPTVRSGAVSVSLLRWECAVRNSAVIGVVGGGGLGSELSLRMSYGEYDKLLTLLLFLILLTGASDAMSQVVRRRLKRDPGAEEFARREHRRLAGVLGLCLCGLAWATLHVWGGQGRSWNLDGWHSAGRMLFQLSRPDLSWDSLGRALGSAAIPLSMAFLGTTLAALLAGLFAYPASWSFQVEAREFTGERRTLSHRMARCLLLVSTRAAALLLRAIPEVLWAMLLVSVLRLGSLPGMLALALHSAGLLARLFTESIDAVPVRTLEVTFAASGSRIKTFLYGAVPVAAHEWLANVFLQFESNVRAAIVLGMVGVGGLGFLFSFEFEFFRYHRAGTYLLIMVALAVSLDRLSRFLGFARIRTD